MSPRAEGRLESIGFEKVHDYVSGKLDWMAAGLPTEGTNRQKPRAGDAARKDTPTCALDERVGEVSDRVKATGSDSCVVVNEQRVVLGLLRAKELAQDRDLLIEQAMRPAPSTFTPFVSLREMAHFMTEHHTENPPITTPDDPLVGLLFPQHPIGAQSDS